MDIIELINTTAFTSHEKYAQVSLIFLTNLVPHYYRLILPIRMVSNNAITKAAATSAAEGLAPRDQKLVKGSQPGLFRQNTGQSGMFPKNSAASTKSLSDEWTNIEKDNLKKNLLLYGYGRWAKIRKASKDHSGFLANKDDDILKAFANGFIRNIHQYIPYDKNELRKYLLNMIEEKPGTPVVETNPNDWGELIKQRATPWGKRLQLLDRINYLIQFFKEEKKKYMGLPESERDKLITMAFQRWDNLLNFLPVTAFYGQRPSAWWTRRHDIDLIIGTYKYGYANYTQMRIDKSLSFHLLEKVEGTFQEFPNADNITRRLKKLVQMIAKQAETGFKFDNMDNLKEPTGYTLKEKDIIIDVLLDIGVPLSNDSKYDWTYLKDKIMEAMKDKDTMKDKNVQQLERFVQRVRMICQQLIQQDKQGISMYKATPATLEDDVGGKNKRFKTGEEDKEETIIPSEARPKHDDNDDEEDKAQNDHHFSYFEDCCDFDPDSDGFNIDFELASKLHNRLNMMYFIRKELLPNKAKIFIAGLAQLAQDFEAGNGTEGLPSNWIPEKHDKALLYSLSDNGFSYLTKLSNNLGAGFDGIQISEKTAANRIEYVCKFYESLRSQMSK